MLLTAWAWTTSTAAQENREGLFNKLAAPGPMPRHHMHLEHTECFACHESGETVSDDKCLACHEDIAKSIAKKSSFHVTARTGKKCFECHPNHKGRNYDTTTINEKTFDHEQTGFSLRHKHRQAKCSECHTQKRGAKRLRPHETRYFGLSPSCKQCHRGDNPHFFTDKHRDHECSRCHQPSKWSNVKFDHYKESGYKLSRVHQKLDCKTCHVPSGKDEAKYSFKNLKQKKCLACHEENHRNNFGKKFARADCLSCHTENTWKIRRFNHNATGFRLDGKHKTRKCLDCHKQSTAQRKKGRKYYRWQGNKSACSSCHKNPHGKDFRAEQGRIGCRQCHSTNGWQDLSMARKVFKHASDKGFALTGRHRSLACESCHVQNGKKIYKFKKYRGAFCNSCRRIA